MTGEIAVHWRHLDGDSDGWGQLRCLYAYFGRDGEILYIGKSWGKTARERWHRGAKEHFWNDLERDRSVFEHSVAVGTIALEPRRPLTSLLLAFIESLLIFENKPWGNVQSRLSRIVRPGLVVRCVGDWPARRRLFHDAA